MAKSELELGEWHEGRKCNSVMNLTIIINYEASLPVIYFQTYNLHKLTFSVMKFNEVMV